MCGMRKTLFVEGEYYHVFNRGVDKRQIFMDREDIERFYSSMIAFNSTELTGSIYEKYFAQKLNPSEENRAGDKLVDIVCFCLNPNHFHFLLRQRVENGISLYMQRLGIGYTNYFNNKHKRSGALFQGKFKSVHVEANQQLLHLSAYINLNNRAHNLAKFGNRIPKYLSSWDEYIKGAVGICSTDIILGQFKSVEKYEDFALSSLSEIQKRKEGLIESSLETD